LVLARNGLSAGLSELAESDRVPDVSRVLAYEAVIEHFYRDLTVIPVRYGCQLASASRARWLLARHHVEYAALLEELEGLAEMGIQILLNASGVDTESNASPLPPNPFPLSFSSGAAYLARKRQHYLGLDRAALRTRLLVEEIGSSLASLYVRRKVEFPDSSRSRLLSLYFLVPRAGVEAFRRAARRLHSEASVKLLLTGPWPPYNFVDCLET
jgi:hypothetical protein